MYKTLILMVITISIVVLGYNIQNNHYFANKKSPNNVRQSFYKKSVEILNFYTNKIEKKSIFTDKDNEYLLGYYRSMPSVSREEVMIKSSLTYLDLIYRNFESNLKENKEEEMNRNMEKFQEQLQEVLKLLELDNK